jgi:hypothetical protein
LLWAAIFSQSALFLDIRRCGRPFLANRRYSLVFVTVSDYSWLVSDIPWYSSLWGAIVSYSALFPSIRRCGESFFAFGAIP